VSEQAEIETAEVEDDAPEEASPEELERRRQALAQITSFGDPVLRSRASEVTEFGPELEAQARRMIELMHDAMGVGLAANQVGLLKRLLVFQAVPEATPRAIVNPVIEWSSRDTATAAEGCLSLPRVVVEVERPLHVRVSAVDLRGELLVIEASGHEARVLQHEIDHLDGVLILERTTRGQRKGAMRALRQGTSYSPFEDEDDEAAA
jgi:peptide deformylase